MSFEKEKENARGYLSGQNENKKKDTRWVQLLKQERGAQRISGNGLGLGQRPYPDLLVE
jgi:hypothetical protein